MSTQPEMDIERRRFTAAEYEQMGRTGVLTEGDRVELLDGEIVMMSPIGPLHAGTVIRLTRLFSSRLGDRAFVSVQNPLRLGPYSEPEPDLVLARPRSDFYTLSHPVPSDIYLLIEIAETSLATDQAVKVPLYAKAGIPEVWVIDVSGETVHVHRSPESSEYLESLRLQRGDAIAPEEFPDLKLVISDLIG